MREIVDPNHGRWSAERINQGRASGYLNPKVHRPIVQFTCLDRPLPRRYAPLPAPASWLDDLDDEALLGLFQRAKTH